MTAIKVEALTDQRLPEGGPGRAENGNFHVSEVDLHWFPEGGKKSVKLKISHASADFDQEGWTAKQAIDGDQKSGWAIFPRVNESHYIVFELNEPLDASSGGRVVVTLKQLWPPKHYIGRPRLSVTDAANGAVRSLPAQAKSGIMKNYEERTKEESTSIASIVLTTTTPKKLLRSCLNGKSSTGFQIYGLIIKNLILLKPNPKSSSS